MIIVEMTERECRDAIWWQPGATSLPNADKTRFDVPTLYRIGIERFSGRRGVPSAND